MLRALWPKRLAPADVPELTLEPWDGFEIAYRAHTTDRKVLEESFTHDRYVPQLPADAIGQGRIVLDIGAHIGGFALLAASKGATVYAIEASRESYTLLRINAALNHCATLTPSHVAISDTNGTVTLHHSPSGTWGHSLTARGQGMRSELVPALTLDAYLTQHGIARVDLLKMNCEGAEFPILLSTPPAVLTRVHQAIVMTHEDLAPTYQTATLQQHLTSIGFTVTRLPDAWGHPKRGVLLAHQAPA